MTKTIEENKATIEEGFKNLFKQARHSDRANRVLIELIMKAVMSVSIKGWPNEGLYQAALELVKGLTDSESTT